MGKRIIALVAIIFGLAVFITASYLNTNNKDSVLDLPSSPSSNKVSNDKSNNPMNNDMSNQNIRQTNIEQTSTTSQNNQNQSSNNSNIQENNVDETNISNVIVESQRNHKNQSPYNNQNADTIKNEAKDSQITKDSKIEQNTQGDKKPIETSLNDNNNRELMQEKDKIKQNEKIQIETSNNDKSNIAAKDSHHSYRVSNQINKDKNDKSIEITQDKVKSSKDSNSLQKHSDIQDKNQGTIKSESLDKLDKAKQTQDNVVIELDSKDKEIYSNKLAQNEVKEDSKDNNQNDDMLKDETSKQKEVANKDLNEDNLKEDIEEQRQAKTDDSLDSNNAIKDYISESKANDLDSNKAIENEDFKKNENKEQNELIIGLDSNNQIKDEINEQGKELNFNQAQNKESYIKEAQKENLNDISEIYYNETIQSLNGDYDTSQQYYKCDSMPRCSDRTVIQKVIISSLRSHAKARYKEELAKKGEKAAKNFIELWNSTNNTVIPKLTSHVSNVREQSFDNNKLIRICKARYYTKVLEDFGNGWSDKKGDKSPMYEAKYRITCNNDNLIVKIVSDTIQVTNQNKNTIKSNQSNLPNKVNLPLCTDDIVYKKLARVSMNSQAQIRAKEEMRRNGKESLEKFMQLWEKTQPIIYNKIVSRIENIQSKGLDNNAKSRICSANYYTEVLEDFGNGWSDKKGDKSAKYEIYFTIRYIDEDESDVTIKILSQNKMRRQ